MTDRATKSRHRMQDQKEPIERALMLIALGLDPRFTYTNHELQRAWRRRMAQIHPDTSGNGVTAAAINAAYLALLGPTDRELVEVRL
jgi:hypothetical protein